MKKKVLYIILFVVIIIAIVLFFVFQNDIVESLSKNKNNGSNLDNGRNGTSVEDSNDIITTKEVLADGTMYSIGDKQPDIVIGDNYYDTQIADIMTNAETYLGKCIEIEGMYLDNEPYTFVGRYSSSSLCPYCSGGYSYMEYVWTGDKIELEPEESWIKVIGTIEKGNDETSYYNDYYYIKALKVEVMNERGIDTVKN